NQWISPHLTLSSSSVKQRLAGLSGLSRLNKEDWMKISVFGLGYVGTVCAACLADQGHTVVGVDVNPEKLEILRSGRSPIVEKDIDALVGRGVAEGRLRVTSDA